MTSCCIQDLYSYPVKSCAGLRHETLRITESGPDQDRHWVLVDARGVFMTQRQFPRMVLIRPQPAPGGLWLRADGQDDCFAPLPQPDAPAVPVAIFGAATLGADQGDVAARWLSAFLGTPCRLLHLHPQAHRPASPRHVVRWLNRHPEQRAAFSPPGEHQFAFADAFPFLVINRRSLQDLNAQLAEGGHAAVDVIRFRPNIVLDGLDPYEEDYLSGFRMGGVRFAFVKPCARCPIPNVDPQTGATADEPGRTLARLRTFPEGVLFGMDAIVALPRAEARLHVGDVIEPEYDFG